MPTIRDLEDLIIDAIYLDILRGKLDQNEQQLEVEYTMGRDLEPGKVKDLLAALRSWCVSLCNTIPFTPIIISPHTRVSNLLIGHQRHRLCLPPWTISSRPSPPKLQLTPRT